MNSGRANAGRTERHVYGREDLWGLVHDDGRLEVDVCCQIMSLYSTLSCKTVIPRYVLC